MGVHGSAVAPESTQQECEWDESSAAYSGRQHHRIGQYMPRTVIQCSSAGVQQQKDFSLVAEVDMMLLLLLQAHLPELQLGAAHSWGAEPTPPVYGAGHHVSWPASIKKYKVKNRYTRVQLWYEGPRVDKRTDCNLGACVRCLNLNPKPKTSNLNLILCKPSVFADARPAAPVFHLALHEAVPGRPGACHP